HYCIQYHPESFASIAVSGIVENFLTIVKKGVFPHDVTE
ncbi:aminodeoxychorismate/anthranilate synthase component II, partial [Staphylococcus pseudintermedius]